MNFKSREKLLASVAALSLLGISPQQTFAAQITTNQAVQQTKKITGNVSDAMGPIIGATVKVKGTKNAAVTDFDGNYTLNVGAGQTVEVTYVGYVTKTFKVGGQSKYDITLVEDNNSLDEVVVVGYGTMKKSDISGASVSMGRPNQRFDYHKLGPEFPRSRCRCHIRSDFRCSRFFYLNPSSRTVNNQCRCRTTLCH